MNFTMKKKIVSMLLCMSMAASMLAGCGGAENMEDVENVENTESEMIFKTDNQNEEESMVYETENVQQIPRIKEEVRYLSTGEVLDWTSYDYDKDNNLEKKTVYDDRFNSENEYGITVWYENEEYQYDKHENPIRYNKYDEDGNIYSYETYENEYDTWGNLIKQVSKYKDEFKREKGAEYDENGNLLNEYLMVAGDDYVQIYEYNEKGDVVRDCFLYPIEGYYNTEAVKSKTDKYYKYDYEYDSQGKLSIKIKYGMGVFPGLEVDYIIEDYIEMGISEYEYDEQGRLINEISKSIQDGQVSDVATGVKYEYDEQGNLIKKIEYISDSDGEEYTALYEYDTFGNITKKEHVGISYTYEYDEQGNLKRKDFYNNGTLMNYIKYIYSNEDSKLFFVD